MILITYEILKKNSHKMAKKGLFLQKLENIYGESKKIPKNINKIPLHSFI